jgi:putative ABC transport system ATP-binding protein
MKPVVLKAENLTKNFGSGHTAVRAVDAVNLEVNAGEIVLVMGPSGSGKTTFLSMLGGLLQPTEGVVSLDDIIISDLHESKLPPIRASKIGFIFQAFNLLDALTVEENILLPSTLTSSSKKESNERASWLIDSLGLSHRRKALPKTLSGGEKQRVAIARALINEPKLILADEPTGNLDSQSGLEVVMTLHDIARDTGVGVLIVTHDPRVEDVADRILWLEDGRLSKRKEEAHIWVQDPVCGMKVDKLTARYSSSYHNQKIDFCSERCKQRFDSQPSSYLASVI